MKILFMFFLFVNISLCQTISVYSGTTVPLDFFTNNDSDFLADEAWYPSLNIGLDYKYHITENISISGFSELNYFLYNSFTTTSAIPEMKFISAEGTNSNVIRFGVMLFYKPDKFIIPNCYIYSGFNYNIENYGLIKLTWFVEEQGYSQYNLDVKPKDYFSHVVGFGFQFFFLKSLNTFAELRYYANYYDRFHISLVLGVSYTL